MDPTRRAMRAVNTTAGDIADLSLVRDAIANTPATIHEQDVAGLAAHHGQTGRVFIAGSGRSGLVSRVAAMRLKNLGLTVQVGGDTTTPAITSGDTLLAPSGSGTTSGQGKPAQTAAQAGARIAAFTIKPPLGLTEATMIITATQKIDCGSGVSRQYSGSSFEQVLVLATEATVQSLRNGTDETAEHFWSRPTNLE